MMCGMKEEEDQEHHSHNHHLHGYQENLFMHQHHQNCGGAGLIFPGEVSWTHPPAPNPNGYNPGGFREPDPFLAPSSSYGGLFHRRSGPPPPHLQFAYHDGPSVPDHHHLRLISEALGPMAHGSGSAPFGLQSELGKMTAQEIMDAKALAASKSHSEAERRRRERINNHFAKLRSILPSTTKTDKASLLAEVIQHVKELKRQTSVIAETSPVPTETDELTVDTADEDGRFVIKASLCCEDRSDLLPDLIKTLKALRLRTLKAEITTLGGRVKNVLFITGEEDSGDGLENPTGHCLSSIQEALKAVMEKAAGDESSSGSVKRQRTHHNNNNINMVDQHNRSI